MTHLGIHLGTKTSLLSWLVRILLGARSDQRICDVMQDSRNCISVAPTPIGASTMTTTSVAAQQLLAIITADAWK